VEQARTSRWRIHRLGDVVVTSLTRATSVQPLTDYRAQRRGGRGSQAATTKEDDFIERLFIANTHDTMLWAFPRAAGSTG